MKALALLLEENSTLSSMSDMADSAVFWKINTDTAAIMLRDKLIVEVSQARLYINFNISIWLINFKISISIYPSEIVPFNYFHCLLPLIEVKSRLPHEDMTLEQAKLSLHFSTLWTPPAKIGPQSAPTLATMSLLRELVQSTARRSLPSSTSTSTSSFYQPNDWWIELAMQGAASTALTWNTSQRNLLKPPWTAWCWKGLAPKPSEYSATFERRSSWKRAACRGWWWSPPRRRRTSPTSWWRTTSSTCKSWGKHWRRTHRPSHSTSSMSTWTRWPFISSCLPSSRRKPGCTSLCHFVSKSNLQYWPEGGAGESWALKVQNPWCNASRRQIESK